MITLPLTSELSFVNNETGKKFGIIFSYGEDVATHSYGVVAELENEITWAVTETEASIITTALHGFGYAWNHLHPKSRLLLSPNTESTVTWSNEIKSEA